MQDNICENKYNVLKARGSFPTLKAVSKVWGLGSTRVSLSQKQIYLE
jgi:hypothetical protein